MTSWSKHTASRTGQVRSVSCPHARASAQQPVAADGSLCGPPLNRGVGWEEAVNFFMTPRGLWSLLASVRRFEITVLTPTETGLTRSHTGLGTLRAEASTSAVGSTVVWHELGHWLSGPLAGIRFGNTTAWRFPVGAPALHVSHLRRGARSPTFLAILRPDARGKWAAEAPHICGADRYHPTLACRGGRLRLEWEVQSPTDAYLLRLEAWQTRACDRSRGGT